MTPTEYEKAVLERFRTDWPPPQFEIKHNIRLLGRKTKVRRQIDISIFETGQPAPFLIVEAKRHNRTIDASKAGATIALVQDVGAIPAVMVSTSSFSVAAQNHLEAEEIGHLTLTLKEAKGLRWLPLLQKRFCLDRAFRHVSGDLVEALRNGDGRPFIDTDIPYEEWLAVISCGQSLFPTPATKVLKFLARNHFEDGVRFNAVMLLMKPDNSNPPFWKRFFAVRLTPMLSQLSISFGTNVCNSPASPTFQKGSFVKKFTAFMIASFT